MDMRSTVGHGSGCINLQNTCYRYIKIMLQWFRTTWISYSIEFHTREVTAVRVLCPIISTPCSGILSCGLLRLGYCRLNATKPINNGFVGGRPLSIRRLKNAANLFRFGKKMCTTSDICRFGNQARDSKWVDVEQTTGLYFNQWQSSSDCNHVVCLPIFLMMDFLVLGQLCVYMIDKFKNSKHYKVPTVWIFHAQYCIISIYVQLFGLRHE